MILGKLKTYGLLALGIITAGLGLLVKYYPRGRDKAREKLTRKKRQLAQTEARIEQREEATKADREGATATVEKRKEARETAEEGKRDHFEEHW